MGSTASQGHDTARQNLTGNGSETPGRHRIGPVEKKNQESADSRVREIGFSGRREAEFAFSDGGCSQRQQLRRAPAEALAQHKRNWKP